MAISLLSAGSFIGFSAIGSVGTISNVAVPAGQFNTAILCIPSAFSNAGTLNRSTGTVTYGGVGLTRLARSQGVVSQINVTQEAWLLLNPPVGTQNLVVTYGGTLGPGNPQAVCAVLSGVSQYSQPDGTAANQINTGTVGTVNITTVVNNSWVFSIDSCNNNGSIVPDPSQTQLYTDGGFNVASYKAITSAGTTTQKYTDAGASDTNLLLAVSLAPAVAGTNLIQSSGTAALGLGSTSATWGKSTTTGNLVIVGVTITNVTTLGTVTSVTDSQSNSYLKAVSGTKSSSLVSVIDEEIWYAANITGGAGSVTVNHTLDNAAVYVREYSGFTTLDAVGSASGSNTSPNSGTVNSNFSNELIVVSTGDDKGTTQTWFAAGNYGDVVGTATTLTGLSMEDTLSAGTAAQTGTLTLASSANWVSALASFYNQSSYKPKTITLMGC